MKKREKIKSNKPIDFKFWEKWAIGFLIVLIIIGPYLFTQLSSGISFADTGAIGDTIGGITAPFVNLLAAFLVYKSFTAQIFANKQQRDDHNDQMKHLNKEHTFNYISNYFNLIKSSYYLNNRCKSESLARSHINFIRIKSVSVPNLSSYVKYINSNDHCKKEAFEKLDKDKNKIVRLLENPIRTVLGHLQNIKLFSDEIEKSDIDIGISHFYKIEIEKILSDMELWHLLDEASLEKIEEFDIPQNPKILSHYQKIKFLAKSLKEKGYEIRR